MSLFSWVKSLGAGWWDEWRDAAEAKAKAAFHAILNTVESDSQLALIAAIDAAKAAALAKLSTSGATPGDIGVAARNAAEASLTASGKTIGQDALNAALAGMLASVAPEATTSAVV